MAGLQVLRFDPRKVNAHERVGTFYANLARVELEGAGSKTVKSNPTKPKAASLKAEDYEKSFVEDDWQEMM